MIGIELVTDLSGEVVRTLIRMITGRLFTDDQIRDLTGSVAGRFLQAYLPEPAEEAAAGERVEAVRHHIAEANRLIGTLKDELDTQVGQLAVLEQTIDEKRLLASRYEALATANEAQAAAFRAEIEQTIRRELESQANRGKRLRQFASAVVWVVTLVLGAALGAYFTAIVAWAKTLLGIA